MGEGENEAIFFESFVHKFFPNKLYKSMSKDLDIFFRLLMKNIGPNRYYNRFIWGNLGNPAYIDKYYPKILISIINNTQETTQLIVTRDTNGCSELNLYEAWQEKTKQILTDLRNFQHIPIYEIISLKEIKIINKTNDIILVSFLLTPRNLEYLIASAYIQEKGLRRPPTNYNDHQLLDEIKTQMNKDKNQVISEAVNLNLNRSWIYDLKTLIERD